MFNAFGEAHKVGGVALRSIRSSQRASDNHDKAAGAELRRTIATTRLGGAVRSLAIALLLSGVLAAQGRKAAVGRVLDDVGRPVAKASVTLFWTAPGDTLGERTDKVEVATDEHGRFMAQLLPQRGYSAFATSPEGTLPRKVSKPRDGLAAGADLELRLDQAAIDAEIELRGANVWVAEQPLRLLALPAARNLLSIALELRENRARLPAVEVLMFAVLDAKARPLWISAGTKDAGGGILGLPPSIDMRFRVVDEKGAPVEGAQVMHVLHTLAAATQILVVGPRPSVLRELGKTDADGRLTASVPVAGNPWVDAHMKSGGSSGPNVTFVATRPGRGTSVAALGGNLCLCNGARLEPPLDQVLTFTLRPQMRLRLLPPVPHANATLATTFNVPVKGGTFGRPWALRCAADAEGWFELPVPDATEPGLLELDDLRLPDGTNVPRCVTEILPGAGDQRCDLTRMRRLSVQVLGLDAGPARGVPVMLLSHSQKCPEATPAYTDQAGRVQVHVGRGDWLVFVTDGERAVWRSLRDADADLDWQLTLQSLPTMVCRIVDQGGKPMAGAALRKLSNATVRAFPEDGEGRRLFVLAQTFAHGQLRNSRSGADGLLRVPMLGDHFTWRIGIGVGERSTAEVEWRAGEEPVTLPIR